MRPREPETLLWLPLLPIFFVGAFPMLLFGILGFAGLVVLGVLLICAGLADALEANSQFNQEIIVHGYARRSERGVQASNLHSAVRSATIANVSGIGLLAAGLFGLFA
jgi:hypothetical protein